MILTRSARSPTQPDEVGSAPEAVVCVATFQRPIQLRATLDSLARQRNAPRFVVVVVDNDATKREGVAVAETYFAGRLLTGLVAVEPRPGNCSAINRALTLALQCFPRAKHVMMLDDDEVADEGWIATMIDGANSSQADIVGGPVLPLFPREATAARRRVPVFWPAYAKSGPVPMIYGSGNMLVARHVFDRLPTPLFDMAFNFLGGGDTDFFARCRQAGMRFYWENNARIYETVSPNRLDWRWIVRRYLRIGAINRRVDERSHLRPRGRAYVLAKDIALVPLSAYRAFRRLAEGEPALSALHPVLVCAGRLLSWIGVEPEQYRPPRSCGDIEMAGKESQPSDFGKIYVLTSGSATPCGVESFARGLASALLRSGYDAHRIAAREGRSDALRLWRGLAGASDLIVNLPVVAWKCTPLLPLIPLILARLRGARTLLILHEWQDLKAARRGVYLIYLFFAGAVAFSSPAVRRQLEATRWAKLARSAAVIPIPANLRRGGNHLTSDVAERIAQERARGRFVLGHFGSIYPKKRCEFILDVASRLRDCGVDVFAAFIGDFVRGSEDIKRRFTERATTLGLQDRMLVSGYVAENEGIFAALDACDAFAYSFEDGLTSRRGSVLTCLQSRGPVFVNAPANAGEFDHHPTYRALMASGALRLLDTKASPADFADAICAYAQERGAANTKSAAPSIFFEAWADAVTVVLRAIRRSSRPEPLCAHAVAADYADRGDSRGRELQL